MSPSYGWLTPGEVLEGQVLRRVGTEIIGADWPAGGGPHAATHAAGQGDALTPAAIGAAAAGHDHAGVYALADHTHPGGGEPWTTVLLDADFVSSSASNVAVTGLAFTPAADKRYLVRVVLLLRTATATVGARPGFAWPTGLSDGGGRIDAPNSATAVAVQCFPTLATANAASTGLANTTASHLSLGHAYFLTGASPSGAFQVTLASETAGTNVTARAGSFLQWREIA